MYLHLRILFVLLLTIIVLPLIECKRPNFVIFLTDDQDLLLDGMIPMKSTIEHIAKEGLTFTNAFVHSPICCPSRSSLLTGKYLHNLRVFNNFLSGNCSSIEWQVNQEQKTIASYLKQKDYVSFYGGKYLNQYGNKKSNGLSHIPSGYDWWYGLEGNSKYYNYSLSINGSKVDFHDEYLTDLLGKFANDFLTNKQWDKGFFMVLAPPAAHAPFIAATRHLSKFHGVKAKKTPSFNASTLNKHWLLQLPPEYLPTNISRLDDIQRWRMQTLLSVDDLVEFIINKLIGMNALKDTYVIYTSDNGFHIGQFGLPWDKRQPYQTDIHIPFLMRGPKIPKGEFFTQPISLVDLAPTILTLADINVPEDMDGSSFAHSIMGTNIQSVENTRQHVFVEYFGEGNAKSVQKECGFDEEDAENLSECSLENWCKCQDSRNNTYSCVVDFNKKEMMKYCAFQDNQGLIEVYNLFKDPFELNNIANTLPDTKHYYLQQLFAEYKKCSGKSCQSLSLRKHQHLRDSKH